MRLGKLSEVLAERRRSPRRATRFLELAYWNGAQAVIRKVREVSVYGAFVETPDQWYPGTVMQMQVIASFSAPAPAPAGPAPNAPDPATGSAAAQDAGDPSSGPDPANPADAPAPVDGHPAESKNASQPEITSFPMMGRVVRCVPAGICVEFTFRSSKEHRAMRHFLQAVEERGLMLEARAAAQTEKAAAAGSVDPTGYKSNTGGGGTRIEGRIGEVPC